MIKHFTDVFWSVILYFLMIFTNQMLLKLNYFQIEPRELTRNDSFKKLGDQTHALDKIEPLTLRNVNLMTWRQGKLLPRKLS